MPQPTGELRTRSSIGSPLSGCGAITFATNNGVEARVEEADGIVTKYHTDPLNPDSDGDTLLDGEEVHGKDIFVYSLMGDGISDDKEIANYVYWGEGEDYVYNPTTINPRRIVSNNSLPLYAFGDIDKDNVIDIVTVTNNTNGTYNISWYSTIDKKIKNIKMLYNEPLEIQIKNVDENYTNEEILVRFSTSIEIIAWNTRVRCGMSTI